MSEPDSAEYFLFTDAAVQAGGHERRGDPPGLAAIGAVLKQRRNGRLDFVGGLPKPIGPANKDAAEYQALIAG
jgi:hypothetical protein